MKRHTRQDGRNESCSRSGNLPAFEAVKISPPFQIVLRFFLLLSEPHPRMKSLRHSLLQTKSSSQTINVHCFHSIVDRAYNSRLRPGGPHSRLPQHQHTTPNRISSKKLVFYPIPKSLKNVISNNPRALSRCRNQRGSQFFVDDEIFLGEPSDLQPLDNHLADHYSCSFRLALDRTRLAFATVYMHA